MAGDSGANRTSKVGSCSRGARGASRGEGVRGQFTFGADARLKKKREIERCQKGGTKLHAKHFLILVLPSLAQTSRLATAVTTKLEKRAVVRNRIKRRIREVFRKARAEFSQPIDMVVIARKDIQACEYQDYEREILGALRSKGFMP